MTTGQPGSGSTVRRILLGSQLRRLREAKGISRDKAGYVIRGSESKISRMELGRVSFKIRDVEDLLTLYGISAHEERRLLLDLANEANSAGWWHTFSDVLPTWFQTYVGLEEAASLIRTYEVQFVPGLLQTPEYARAVVRLGQPTAPKDEIDRRVDLRLARQSMLDKPMAPRLWAILDEGVLRRPVGGSDVMRAQIEHLIELTSSSNVVIQVVPFQVGGHAAEGGAFTILRFREPELADVVYLEQLTSALYLDKRDDVDRYAQVMERVSVDALPPDRTTDALHLVRDDFR